MEAKEFPWGVLVFGATKYGIAPLAKVEMRLCGIVLLGNGWPVRGSMIVVLNRPEPSRSTRLLLDLKSGGAWPEHPEDMRLYALLYTLRTGVPPLRVATFLLSCGEWQPEEVTEEMLERAASRVVTAVRAAARGLSGGAPILDPGPHCRRCPRRSACPAAASMDASVPTGGRL